jgi:cytochrome P450/NADPH-cytochrome P450 reductase
LDVLGERITVINDRELLNEVCNESKFRKLITGSLFELKDVLQNGLITTDTTDPKWRVAHRIAMPAFNPAKIRNMFPSMKDITGQLCLKWQDLIALGINT